MSPRSLLMDSVDRFNARMGLIAFLLGAIGAAAALIHYAFWPPKPPSQSWADGTYLNACCEPLILHQGNASTHGISTSYSVENGKRGNYIDVPLGIRVSHRHVVFGGTLKFVNFNTDGDVKSLDQAHSLQISGLDDDNEYVFKKQ